MKVNVDVVSVLRDLRFDVQAGRGGLWRIESPERERFVVVLSTPVERISASTARARERRPSDGMHLLLTGRTITDEMLERARSGVLDVLTQDPPRVLIGGREFGLSDGQSDGYSARQAAVPRSGRPAWIRWAVMRCLLLATEPLRQIDIAALLQVKPQSVSYAVKALGDHIERRHDRFAAANKPALLEQWWLEYPGTGGRAFGWFSLDPIAEQTLRANEIASLWEARPLVSGDVAADRMAPWKRPTRSKIYVKESFDLEEDGFVPAPIDEATLVISVPEDPTLWSRLSNPVDSGRSGYRFADAVIVYWDVRQGTDPDSSEAAEKLANELMER